MADKTISVEITGDASGLAAAAERARAALSGISGAHTSAGIAAGKNVEAVKQTERELKNLESGLKRQKDTTLQYTRSLRDSTKTFNEKKTAVQAAATAYKANSVSIKENGEYLRYQLKLLDGTVSTNKEHIASLQSSNKYLKRNSDEYKTNRTEIKSLQAENKRLADDRKALSISILDNEKALQSETDKYKNAQIEVKKAAAEYRGIKSNLEQSKKVEAEYSESIAKTNEQLSERKNVAAAATTAVAAANSKEKVVGRAAAKPVGKQWQEYGEAIDKATKPLQVLAVGTAAVGAASAKAAISFEDNFASVKKTVEGTPEQLEKIKQGLIDMTTVGVNGRGAIPQTTAQLTELAAAGGQLGIATDNIVDFTETMAQMNTATNLVGAEGAAVLARFMNVTNTSQGEVSNLGSAIVDLGNNFATTESEIAALSLRMGETGGVVGISAQDILAYSTALSSMGIEAEAGGSAVSRIWMDMQKAVANGGADLQAFAKTSGKSAAEFKKQWQNDASGAFQDFIKGLSETDDQISKLAELGFNNIRDIAALQALASTKGIDLMTDALERSNKAWAENTALQTEADAKAQTTAGQIQIAKNNVTEAARSFGEVMLPTIVDVTGKVSEFSQKLAGMDDAQKRSLISTGATVAGMGLLAKGTAGAIKTVGTIATAIGKIPTPVGVAIGAIGGLAAVALKAKDAYVEYREAQLNWSEGMSEDAEAHKTETERLVKLRDLYAEYRQLTDTVDKSTNTDEVSAANARIEEIKEILSGEYNVSLDSSSIDAAIQKAINLQELLTESEESELRNDIVSGKDKFDETRKKIEGYENQKTELEAQKKAYTDASANIQLMQKSYNDLGAAEREARQSEFVLQWNNIADALGDEGMRANMQGITKDGRDLFSMLEQGQLSGYKFTGTLGELNKEISDTDSKIKETKPAMDEYMKSAKSFADQQIAEIAMKSKNGGNIAEDIEDLKLAIDDGGLALNDYTLAAAEAMSGTTDLAATLANGGDALDKLAVGYVSSGKSLGMSADEAARGAAVLKAGFTEFDQAVQAGKTWDVAQNFVRFGQQAGLTADEVAQGAAIIASGFKSVEDAAAGGDDAVNNVIASMREFGDTTGIFEGMDNDAAAQKLTDMAHAMELIPESKTVSFNVEKNGFEVIDNAANAVERLNRNKNIKLKIDAAGNVTILDTADKKLDELRSKNQIDIKFNVENNNFDIFDKAGQKLGVIEADGVVKWGNDTTEPDRYKPEEKQGTVVFTADTSRLPKSITINGTVSIASVVGGITGGKTVRVAAAGTDNFPGGLAMVNDQRGIPDPRELIVDKGRAFIPNGRDVILPLSKGAKVYTAAETKRIMSGIGIPRYASGKDNSDAFTNARDEYSHYTATHAVTTAEQLEKWNRLLKETAKTDKDVADAEEEIYSLRQKLYSEQLSDAEAWLTHAKKYNGLSYDDTVATIRDMEAAVAQAYDDGLLTKHDAMTKWRELDEEYLDGYRDMLNDSLEASKNYFAVRSRAGDWEAVGDDPITAYERVKAREAEAARTSNDWRTYYENMQAVSGEFIDNTLSGFDTYFDRMSRYYGANATEMLQMYDEMWEGFKEYLAQMELSEKQLIEINDKYKYGRADKLHDVFEQWQTSADTYYKIRETFDDWDKVDDSKSRFWIASLAQVEQAHRNHEISWPEYMDESREKYLSLYQAVSEEYEDKLREISDEMSEVSKNYADYRSELTREHEQKTRDDDIAEVNRLLKIYENAVTDAGQQKYKDLLEQREQLRYQQSIAELEEDEQAELDDLQDSYDAVEAEKQRTLDRLRTSSFNIFGHVKDMNIDTSDIRELAGTVKDTVLDNAINSAVELENSDTLVKTVLRIENRIRGMNSGGVYYNNGTYHIASGESARDLIERLTGTVVSGLGSVMIG